MPEETEWEVPQKLSGAQSVQSNMGDRFMLNSSWIHPASSVLPTQAHQFCLNDLAHPFPGCPGNKAKKVSTELNGHQTVQVMHHANMPGPDEFHKSKRFWWKQAQRSNTLYPPLVQNNAFRKNLFGVLS